MDNNNESIIPRIKSTGKQTYGLNVSLLRKWQKERTQKLLDQEFAKQEIAVAKVRSFLDAVHRIVHIQSWYRMLQPRHRYNARKRAQLSVKYTYFRGVKLYWKSEKMFRVQIFGKFFIAWRDETRLSKDMQIIIQEFFKSCIQKLRLTPQACMAFFNQEKWSRSIPKSDMLKIRRLMLQKLFFGWKAETRDLSVMRYKASQVLSRMVRRTKGPLWVKESALVCFHMWFRYISVKKAYRLELPDPRYNNPFLPQWTKLFKEITVTRIKKKRTHELGKFLTQLRCYKKWRMLMTMDRSKPITPLAVAIMHYSLGLLRKVVTEWSELLKERGKIARFRDKIFLKWKKWAPHHRDMRLFQAKAIHLIRYKQMENAYKIMIKICFHVIGKRTEKIKELRRNFCDRKVMICAYALLHKSSHLMMVDCWRRLWLYWKNRKNWKALNWRFAYLWHSQRSKVLFECWKEFIVMAKAERKPSHQSFEDKKVIETVLKNTKKPATLTRNGSSGSLSSDSSTDDEFPNAPNTTLTTSINNAANVEIKQSMKSSHTVSILRKSLINRSRSVIQSSLHMMSLNDLSNNSSNANEVNMKRRGAQGLIVEPDRDRLVRKFASIALELIKDGTNGRLQSAFSNHAFQIFCLATVKAYKELITISTTITSEKSKQQVELFKVHVQDNLQLGIDSANLKLVIEAISDGAIVLSSHLRQVSRHIGDQYMPLFALLLLNSVLFFTERIVKDDSVSAINNIINPINAYLVATQLERWKKNELTVRETSSLSQSTVVHNYITSCSTSKYMWRVVVLGTIERKAKGLSRLCIELPSIHSVDEEVTEIYKRQKLSRLYELRNSLTCLFGIETMDNNASMIPPLVKSTNSEESDMNNNISVVSRSVTTQEEAVHNTNKDIYTVLREYTLLTGKLATEAKALRMPLMERDERLIVNGFLKQSHSDYLELRRLCMKNQPKNNQDISIKKKKRPNSSKKKKRKTNVDKIFKNLKGKPKIQDIFNALLKEDLNQPINMRGDEDESEDGYSTSGGHTSDKSSAGEEESEEQVQGNYNNNQLKKILKTTLRKYSSLSFLQENMQEEEDLKKEIEFQERVISNNHNSPVLIEIWQPKIWKVFLNNSQAQFVKSLYSCWNICAAQSVVMRTFFLLNSDSTITPLPEYSSLHSDSSKITSYGMWFINHVLEQETCRLSPTWTVLPQDYWNFESIANKFSIELAFISSAISGMKSKLEENLHINNIIDKDLLIYQKFLKNTRKYIMDISDKRFTKHDADKLERIPFISQGKKIDIKIKSKQVLVSTLQEKINKANVQVAVGNLNGAAELFVQKNELEATNPGMIDSNNARNTTATTGKSITSPSQKNKGKGKKDSKNSENEVAVVEINYDYATIHGFMADVQEEIEHLKNEIQELQANKKEKDHAVRLFDWQCQRTTRMLRDLAAGHFETMVDVQSIALRENIRLKDSENKSNAEIRRIRSILRYQHSINNFLTGNLENRKLQLKREAEQKKVSDLLYRKNSSGDTTLPKGNWNKIKKMNVNNISIGSTINDNEGSNGKIEDNHVVNSTNKTSAIEQPTSLNIKTSKLKDKILSSILSPSLVSTTVHLMQTLNENSSTKQSPPLKPLTIDEELALAHYNSAENVKKREDELKRLADEQAEEMIANDLRLRLFDEYWSSLPNHLHERRGSVYVNNNDMESMDLSDINTEPQISLPKLLQNRTEKLWESIGKQYWRTKEHFIRSMMLNQRGNDAGMDEEVEVLKTIMEAFRPIDPLDEVIVEPNLKKMKKIRTIDYNDEIDDDSIAGSSIRSTIPKFDNNLHATQIRLFTETMSDELSGNIWKSTLAPEFGKMVSVSMKQLHVENTIIPIEIASKPNSRAPSRAATAPAGGLDSVQSHNNNEEDGSSSIDSIKPKLDPFSIIGKGEYLKFQFGMFSKGISSVGGDSGIEFDNASIESRFTNIDDNILEKETVNSTQLLIDNVVNTPGDVDNFDVLSQTSSALHSIQVKQYLDLIDESNDSVCEPPKNDDTKSNDTMSFNENPIKDKNEYDVKEDNAFLDLMSQVQNKADTDPSITALDLMLLKTNALMNNIVSALIEEETSSVITSIHSEILSKADSNNIINYKADNSIQMNVLTNTNPNKSLEEKIFDRALTTTSPKQFNDVIVNHHNHQQHLVEMNQIPIVDKQYLSTGDVDHNEIKYLDVTETNDNMSVTSDVSMDQDLQQLGMKSNKNVQKDVLTKSNYSSTYPNNITSKLQSDRKSKLHTVVNNENTENKTATNLKGNTFTSDENLLAVAIGGQWHMQPSPVVIGIIPTLHNKERAVSPTQISSFTNTTNSLESAKHLELTGKKVSLTTKRPVTPLLMTDEIHDHPSFDMNEEDMDSQRITLATPHRLATELGLTGLEDSVISGIYSAPSEDLQNLVKEFSIEKEREELKRLKLEEQSKLSFFPPNFRQSKVISSVNNNLQNSNNNNNNKDMHLLLNSVLEDSSPNVVPTYSPSSKRNKNVEFFDPKNREVTIDHNVNKIAGTKIALSTKMKYMLNHKDLYNPNELRLELMNNMLLSDELPTAVSTATIEKSSSVIDTASVVATEIRKYIKSRESAFHKQKGSTGTLSKNTILSDNYKIAIQLRNESAKRQLKNKTPLKSINPSTASTSTLKSNNIPTVTSKSNAIIEKDNRVTEQSSSPNFWVNIEKKSPSLSPVLTTSSQNENQILLQQGINKQQYKNPENNSHHYIMNETTAASIVNIDDSQSLIHDFDDFSMMDMNEIPNHQEFQYNNNNNQLSSLESFSSIFGNTDSINIDDPKNLTRLSHHDLLGRNSSPLNSNRFGHQHIHHNPIKILIKAKKIQHPIKEILKENEIVRPRTPIRTLTKINKSVTSNIILEPNLTNILNISSNKNENVINNKTIHDISTSKSTGNLLKTSSLVTKEQQQQQLLNKHSLEKLQINTNYNVADRYHSNNSDSLVHAVKSESRRIIDEIAKIDYPYYSDDLIDNNTKRTSISNKTTSNTKNNNSHVMLDTPTFNLKFTLNPIEPPVPPQFLTTISTLPLDNKETINSSNLNLTTSINSSTNQINIEFQNNIHSKNNMNLKTTLNNTKQIPKNNKQNHENDLLKSNNLKDLNDIIRINNISNQIEIQPIKRTIQNNINNHSQFKTKNNQETDVDEDEMERELRDVLEEEHRKDNQEAYRKHYYDSHKQHLYHSSSDSKIPFKVGGTNVFAPIETGVFGGSTKLHVYKGFVRNNVTNNDNEDENNNSFLPPIDAPYMNKNIEKSLNDTLFTQKLVKTNIINKISPAARLLQSYLNKTHPKDQSISLHRMQDEINDEDDNDLIIDTNTKLNDLSFINNNMKGSFNSVGSFGSNDTKKNDNYLTNLALTSTLDAKNSVNSNNSLLSEDQEITTNISPTVLEENNSSWKHGNIDILHTSNSSNNNSNSNNNNLTQKSKRKKHLKH